MSLNDVLHLSLHSLSLVAPGHSLLVDDAHVLSVRAVVELHLSTKQLSFVGDLELLHQLLEFGLERPHDESVHVIQDMGQLPPAFVASVKALHVQEVVHNLQVQLVRDGLADENSPLVFLLEAFQDHYRRVHRSVELTEDGCRLGLFL